MKRLLLFISASVTVMASAVDGQSAYETSLFALIRNRCSRCHGGNPNADVSGPPFAVEDVAASYQRIRRYVRFDDVTRSYLVVRGGNRHCLNSYGFDCNTGPEEISAAIRAWWEGGEREVASSRPRTEAQDLSEVAAAPAFTTIRWNLLSLLAGERGFLEMQVQRYRERLGAVRGAYRFRRPRIVSSTRSVRVSDLRFLVNDREDAWANLYSGIDLVSASPHPLLSPHAQIVLRDRPTGDHVALSFGRLETATAPDCREAELFARKVEPLIAAGGCRSCHGAAGELSLTAGSSLCRLVLQRSNPVVPRDSVFFALGFRALLGHPAPVEVSGTALRDFMDWLQVETGVGPRTVGSAPSLPELQR